MWCLRGKFTGVYDKATASINEGNSLLCSVTACVRRQYWQWHWLRRHTVAFNGTTINDMQLQKCSGHYTYHTVVTVCTAQWSLYVPHSGHYMYRTVVTVCTAQWSLYVPHSGHYMYRTVATIRTTQWSLYVPHSGHYMYRTVVTICTAQWSLYIPQSGHYMYRTVVTICTAGVNTQQLYVLPTQCIYVFCVDLRTNSGYFHIQH